MELPVLIEPVPGGFRAAAFSLTAEGATRKDALCRLEELVESVLKGGASIVTIELPPPNPWAAARGVYENDPYFDEWQEAIRQYRREVDQDTEAL